MTKAYSYIRFSTPRQTEGDSFRRQLEAALSWCSARGLTLDDRLVDLGVSAFRGANRSTGALASFLALVKSRKIEIGSFLLVESLDRLSREAAFDGLRLLMELMEAGITVVSLEDGQEYSADGLRSEWTPLLLSLAKMARSHDESKIKSMRVAEVWAQKRIAARSNEKKPISRRCPEWLDLIGGEYVENDRVAVVKKIFKYTIDGYGRRMIVQKLNEEGILPFRINENWKIKPVGWQASSVAKIIANRSVLGEYQPFIGSARAKNRRPDGKPIGNYYPRIINDETFWHAQSAVSSRLKHAAGRKGLAGGHILQGLAQCGSCGGPMHIQNKGAGSKGGVYLACSSFLRSAGCSNARRWRTTMLEKDLLEGLGCLEANAFQSIDDLSADLNAKVLALKAKLEHGKNIKHRLLEAIKLTDDIDALAEFEKASQSIKQMEVDLNTIQSEAAKRAADPGISSYLINATTISSELASADVERVRDLSVRLDQ